MTRGARTARRAGAALLVCVCLLALFAPFVAPHGSNTRFPQLLNAPPTSIHFLDGAGPPHVHPWTRVNQLEQRYEEESRVAVPLRWFSGGHLVQSADDSRAPLLLLGADSYGRDVFSRLLFGARVSLGLALVAALGALVLGALAGAIAGYAGGASDSTVMAVSDFVLVLPAMYVALALRAVLPLVLSAPQVFLLLAVIFAVIGAPLVARGVRAVVRTERALDYAAAAESLGASPARVLFRHLLPAARGFLAVQATLLVPGFIVSEATLSYVGLGFPDLVPSWGTMLTEAATLGALSDFPWLLSPAVAMFLVVLGLNLVTDRRSVSR